MDLFSPRASGGDTVLFVCTGNICRSALAAAVLRDRLGAHGNRVASAGLHAVAGAPMDTVPAEIARRVGASTTHRARQIDESIVADSGLILTMTGAQRSELLSQYPTALRRTFTLGEFARILETTSLSSESLAALVVDAAGRRPAPGDTTPHDVEDPYRQTLEVHERVGAQIIYLLNGIVGPVGSAIRS